MENSIAAPYHPTWQNNRLNFILSKYPKEYWEGKTLLELGPCNGFFGNKFKELGSDVCLVEGRQENVDKIKKAYPGLKIECFNLDTPHWKFGKFDAIINFGLIYHFQDYHKEHLTNCIKNCDLLLFESVIYDSYEAEICYHAEEDDTLYRQWHDQSMSKKGGDPSTKYIEDIFDENNVKYTKFTDAHLNGDGHVYDWLDTNSKNKSARTRRRFWIVDKSINILGGATNL